MNAATPYFRDGRQFPSQGQLDEACAQFAELMSENLPLNDCADRMGVTRGTGAVLYSMICARVGEHVSP